MSNKIDLTVKKDRLERAVKRAKEQNIIIPTFAQMKNPALIPDKVKNELKGVGLVGFCTSEPFQDQLAQRTGCQRWWIWWCKLCELPSSLTGTKAESLFLLANGSQPVPIKWVLHLVVWFRGLVTGQFDPTTQKAVWPSTGNFCRGGAYDSKLLACDSIAILPEGMSKERFEWLAKVSGEVIATPGSESNVKEIFDKCWELRKSGQDLMIFNQFEEFGNYLWHYEVTGHAMEEVLKKVMGPKDELSRYLPQPLVLPVRLQRVIT